MGNSNPGNRTNVDREQDRSNTEYADYINANRDPASSQWFGAQGRNALRGEALTGFRGGGGYNPYSFPGMENDGGSSYGGDANWDDSSIGDSGSARGTYEDFSKTGGVDATAMRRANTLIPSFYDAYKSSAQRRMNTQGGYSPGFDAQQAEIGRQAGREGFNSARQTEGDIARLTQSGRLAGASGLLGLGQMETQNNQFNTSGRFSAAEGNANRRQGANQFDTGMDLERARFGEGQRQFGAEFGEGQRRFNASGIADMYGRDDENYYRNMDNYLRGIQGRSGNVQNLLGMRTEPTSRWSSIGRGIVGLGQTALQMYGAKGMDGGSNKMYGPRTYAPQGKITGW